MLEVLEELEESGDLQVMILEAAVEAVQWWMVWLDASEETVDCWMVLATSEECGDCWVGWLKGLEEFGDSSQLEVCWLVTIQSLISYEVICFGDGVLNLFLKENKNLLFLLS